MVCLTPISWFMIWYVYICSTCKYTYTIIYTCLRSICMCIYIYTYTSIHTCCLLKMYLREAALPHMEYGKIESRSPVIPPIFSQCIDRFPIDDVSDNHKTNSPQKADQLSFQYLNTSISTPLLLDNASTLPWWIVKSMQKWSHQLKKSGT